MDTSNAFTEMTVQYLLELEWTARTVLGHLNRRLSQARPSEAQAQGQGQARPEAT